MRICKYCDTENKNDSIYCKNCGMPLGLGKKINCDNCGEIVDISYKFCPNCGAKLENKRKCPECWNLVYIHDKYCNKCCASLIDSDKDEAVKSKNQKEKESVKSKNNINDNKTELDNKNINSLKTNRHKQTNKSEIEKEEQENIDDKEEIDFDSMDYEKIKNNPDIFIDYCLKEGKALLKKEKYKEAINWFNKGVGTVIKNNFDKEEDVRLVKLYINRGDAFNYSEQIKRAKDNYKRALIYAQSILAVDEVKKIKKRLSEIWQKKLLF